MHTRTPARHRKTMTTYRKIARTVAFASISLLACAGAFAQNSGSAVFQNINFTGAGSGINSAVIHSRVFNDYPGATFAGVNNYPSLISLSEANVVGPSGFANRDDWRFSSNGGVSDHLFGHTEYWSISAAVTLTGTPISPRKEAGFR